MRNLRIPPAQARKACRQRKDGAQLGLCEPHRERQSRVRHEDVLYAPYHAAVEAMIEDAGVLFEVIQTETEVEMQPRNKAAMDEVEQQIIELQERVLDLHKQKRAMKISDAYYNAQVNDYSQQLGALEGRQHHEDAGRGHHRVGRPHRGALQVRSHG